MLSFCSSQQAVTMASMRSFVQILTLCSAIGSSLAATAKPALILVPGAFHRASVYDEVKAQLGDVGYERVDAIDLPSVGEDVADVERIADTNTVTGLLETRLSNGEDVILVGNSYGATVIMEAVKEFEGRSTVSAHKMTEGEGSILGLIMVRIHLNCLWEEDADGGMALWLHSHNRRSQS
jgi:pimeloyl-ACP methyl ester carboxylesterase